LQNYFTFFFSLCRVLESLLLVPLSVFSRFFASLEPLARRLLPRFLSVVGARDAAGTLRIARISVKSLRVAISRDVSPCCK
jgi:hypothetical protein